MADRPVFVQFLRIFCGNFSIFTANLPVDAEGILSYTKHNQSKGSEEKSKRCGTLQRARMVGTGAEDTAEDGLGAAHRLRFLPHRPRRERPLQRQGMLVPAEASAARRR